MSAEAPWLDAPIVEDDPEPWKSAPVVEDPEQPWLSAPVVEEDKPASEIDEFVNSGAAPSRDLQSFIQPANVNALSGGTEGTAPTGEMPEVDFDWDKGSKMLAEDLMSPTFEIVPRQKGMAAVATATELLAPPLMPLVEGAKALGLLPKEAPKSIERPAAVMQNVVADTANFFTSPVGIGTLGLSAAPAAVQKVVAGLFALHAAKESPETYERIKNAKTPEERDEAITAGLEQLLVMLGGAKHGLDRPGTGGMAPADRIASMGATRERLAAEKNAGAPPAPIIESPPDAATPAPLAEPVVAERVSATGEALTEAAAPDSTRPGAPAEAVPPKAGEVAPGPLVEAGKVAEEIKPPVGKKFTMRDLEEKGRRERAQEEIDAAARQPEGSGAKLGPGAANIEEPLASYELRKFGERFVEDKTIDPTIREQTGNRYYEPLPNRVTAEEAARIVNERGIDETTSLIRDEKNDVSPAVRSTMGQVVIKRLNESYRALKETNPVEASKVLDKAVDLAEWQMEYGTRLGQGVQSFAMWSRLTPEGKLRTYVKSVDKARVRVEKETNGEVKKVATAAREVSERTESKPKEDAIEREANRIAKHLSDTPEFSKTKAPNEAVVLIREHLKSEVPDFTTKIEALGAKPETAAQLDRMATENRKRIAAIGREQRIEALRKRLTSEKNATGKKLKKSTVERLIELADDGLLKDAEVWNAVSKDLGLPEYTPAVAKEMGRLAAEVDGAAEGMPRNEAMQRLTNYMASQKGFSPGDLPLGIYYGNILSGYNTHIVNAVDTGLNVFSELGNMALNNPKEIPSIVRGVIRGLGEGKSDAILALSEGRRITEGKYAEQPGILEASKFGKEGGVPIQTKGIVGKAMKYVAESKVAAPLNAYKYVGRLMAASDTVFFRAAEEARAGVLAFREAQAKGVEKAQLRAEADKLLGYDRIDQFREQAKSEGYTGAKAEARTTELMMQERPEALRESAADFAGNATYNHAPEGLLGYAANTMSQVTNKVPALKLIVPFTRIVANVTNRGLDWTPWGYKRALAGRTFGDGPMFGEARTAALTKATVGMIGLTTVGVLNQLGVIQLHGGGPSDTEKKKQLQSAGWKPYTIQVGDTYISYLPTPLGLGLSTMANYLDADRYQELKQKDALTRTAYALTRIPSTIFNQSFLSGLSTLFESLSSSSPGKQIASLKQMFSRISAGFVVPNIARDVNRIFDPSYRDTDSIAEDLIRDIPVIRLSLNPTLNAFGEPAEQPSNRFVSVRKSAPEWRLVVDKNLRIPVADETVFTDPQAGYEYQKLAGEGMKSYVSNSLSSLKSKTPDAAQEAITKASASIFENARSRVRSKYPNSLRQRK